MCVLIIIITIISKAHKALNALQRTRWEAGELVNVLIWVQWVSLSGMVGFVCVCRGGGGGGVTLRKDIVKLAVIEASAGL